MDKSDDLLFDEENEQIIDEDILDKGLDAPKEDKDLTKRNLNLEKSYKSQQKFVSQLQKENKEIKELLKKQKEESEKRDKKVLEAFGAEESADDKARKQAEQLVEKPVETFSEIARKIAVEESSKIKKELSSFMDTSNKNFMDNLTNKFQSEYDFDLFGKEAQVAARLEKFSLSEKKKNPYGVLVDACTLVNKAPLKKKEFPFFEEGSSDNGRRSKSAEDAFLDEIQNAPVSDPAPGFN